MGASFRHLFGPVPSRRYGRSLGVDLAVSKTCSLNCLFCQLGPTPHTTLARTDAPPLEEVLDELRRWFASGQTADFVTAAGSGEPTLHVRFGDLLRWVHAETPCRSLLLSNGSLFHLPEVRRDAALADVVKVSLHAWDQTSFERIVRPHPDLRFDAVLDGYRAFRQSYAGRLDLEVFIVPGLNDRTDQVRRIADLARSFSPDTIALNTAVRPPAEGTVAACPPERLRELEALFGPSAHAAGAEPEVSADGASDEALVAMVARHPVSLRRLAAACHTDESAMRTRLEALARRGLLRLFESRGTPFVGPFTP